MEGEAAKSCSRCDSPLTGLEKICPNCKRPLAGEKLASAPQKSTLCPICKLSAYSSALNGLPVLHCAECQGLACPRETMMKLQPHGPKKMDLSAEELDYKRPPFFEPRKKPPFLICPFCSKRMKEEKIGGLAVDLCTECDGLWIDGPKNGKFGDILGPYKWKMTNAKKR